MGVPKGFSKRYDFVAPNNYGLWVEVCGKQYLFGNKIVRKKLAHISIFLNI